MARADLTIVQRLVYDNLAVRTGAYGTLDATNQRYPDAYIDDNIAAADIAIVNFLIKNKQHQLLNDLEVTSAALNDGDAIPNSWVMRDVQVTGDWAMKVSKAVLDLMRLEAQPTDAKDFYAIHEGRIYVLGAKTATITYIDLTHPTSLATLKSPTGFESAIADLATAYCLIKRNDKPEEQRMRKESCMEFLQTFMTPPYSKPFDTDI